LRSLQNALHGSIIDKKIAEFKDTFRNLQVILSGHSVLTTELTTIRILKSIEQIDDKMSDIRKLHFFFR
jgi:predicted ATP-binding protein involved in virulence